MSVSSVILVGATWQKYFKELPASMGFSHRLQYLPVRYWNVNVYIIYAR